MAVICWWPLLPPVLDVDGGFSDLLFFSDAEIRFVLLDRDGFGVLIAFRDDFGV